MKNNALVRTETPASSSPLYKHRSLILLLLPTTIILASTLSWVRAHDDQIYKHTYLKKFDIIDSTDIKESVLVTRDTGQDGVVSTGKLAPRKFSFSALGRTFRLILNQAPNLISPSFKIYTVDEKGHKSPFTYKDVENQVLQGHLEGDPNSLASATLMGKTATTINHKQHPDDNHNGIHVAKGTIMATHIKTGNDFFVVEPSYLHQDNLKTSSSELSLNNTMIVYNLNDHKSINDSNSPFKPHTFCDQINMNDYLQPKANSTISTGRLPLERVNDSFRAKRSALFITPETEKKSRCSLMIVVDTLFFQNVGRHSLTTTVNYVLGLMDRVNMIFINTSWSTGGDLDEEPITKIGFTVQSVEVHTKFHIVSQGEKHYNMETNTTWGAKEYLENFSRHADSRWYCLAHLLTYRKFDSTVLGLAFVASARPGSIGGICSERYERDGVISYFNTGISTSLSVSGETLITRQADLVVAHELGHNFGAEHDIQDLKCSPKPSQGGAYLMHAYSVPGFEKNNRIFSPCSRTSIWKVLQKKSQLCFSGVQKEVCGNGIVEKGEECDGGNIGHGYEDQCCDNRCQLRPGTTCSDRHSLCCTNCQITPASQVCRNSEQYLCKQASYCDGMSSECPPPPPAEDGTNCTGTGECRSGECMPFCETKGMRSCLCESPKTACKLCCKSRLDDAQECRPYEDSKLPPLADGTLCYRGVCEKGRCEQNVQDVVERFWDVIEDINFSTVARVLRDNIVIVALFISIPIWLIGLYLVNKFDQLLMAQLTHEIINNTNNNNRSVPRKNDKESAENRDDDGQSSHPSAFLPTYFGDPSMPPAPPPPGFKGSTMMEDENGFYPPTHNVTRPYSSNAQEDESRFQVGGPTFIISNPNQRYIDDDQMEEIEDNIRNGRRITHSTQV